MPFLLIIDDDPQTLEMIKMVLARFDYEVTTVVNGVDGIQKFNESEFDLVITDICMPRMDVNAVARHIRNSDKHHTPVIGISGTPWMSENTYFDDILPKPLSIPALIASVRELIIRSKKVA